MRMRTFARRIAMMLAVLVLTACGAKAPESAQSSQPAASEPKPSAPAPAAEPKKITYWGGLIFSDEANKMVEARVNEWGKANNVEVDVVMINQNETNTKISAAIESGQMPDAFDMGLDLLLLLSSKDLLLPLDELYAKVGKDHGGWIKGVDDVIHLKDFGGQIKGIPFGASGNLLNIRNDALEGAGYEGAPKTWQELGEMAEKTTKPPLYGMGFSLSNVGDGNLMVQVMQSFGGRIADDTGKKVTLKSPETKAFLEWVTGLYKLKLFPPGAVTWDGAGDNNAYQSGHAVFIANPGSVYLWMQKEDKDLMAGSIFAALPAGPKHRISPMGVNVRGIAKTTKHPEEAKQLIEYMADKTFMEAYYKVAIYGPVLKEQLEFELFKTDPFYLGLADLVQNGTAPAWPDVYNTAYADVNNNFLIPKMIQRVVVDGWAVDRAIDEAQKAAEAIYAKYD